MIDYTGAKFPKPEPRQRTARRTQRQQADRISTIRQYVFARERHLCRCCRCRPAESMHELKPRSLGGKASRTNSIAVCGDGVQGCHGHLQAHRIAWGGSISGAEDVLYFTPQTPVAAEWLKILVGDQIVPAPMAQVEQEA